MANETKSRRVQLLVKPTVYAELKREASANGCSFNDIANRLFENAVNNYKLYKGIK